MNSPFTLTSRPAADPAALSFPPHVAEVPVTRLMDRLLASTGPLLRTRRCRLVPVPIHPLGTMHAAPEALVHALGLLVRGAIRSTRNEALTLTIERFPAGDTGGDWLEWSLSAPRAMCRDRYTRAGSVLRHLECRVEQESDRKTCAAIYRVYVPCDRTIIPIEEGWAS